MDARNDRREGPSRHGRTALRRLSRPASLVLVSGAAAAAPSPLPTLLPRPGNHLPARCCPNNGNPGRPGVPCPRRPSYLSAVNEAEQTVTSNSPVLFATDRLSSGSCIQHTAGTSAFTLACPGVYLVEYNAKADLVEKARMYKNCAISVSGEVAPEARVAIAQAANDLLTIQGVDASFVAVQVGTGVNISARSLGAVNVQVIMESLGGGGHQTMAAAQLKHITPEAARARIEGAIDKYYASQKKGDVEGK